MSWEPACSLMCLQELFGPADLWPLNDNGLHPFRGLANISYMHSHILTGLWPSESIKAICLMPHADAAPAIHFIIYLFSRDTYLEYGTGYNLFLCLLKNWNFSKSFVWVIVSHSIILRGLILKIVSHQILHCCNLIGHNSADQYHWSEWFQLNLWWSSSLEASIAL